MDSATSIDRPQWGQDLDLPLLANSGYRGTNATRLPTPHNEERFIHRVPHDG